MTRRLIVNADDFGLTSGVSAGILAAYRHGIVSSTTVLATAAIDAKSVSALRDSGLGVGLHVNLTLGRPLSGARSLVDSDGRFVRDARHAAARADVKDVEREIEAQIEKFLALTKRPPTHLDTHHHVGFYSPVAETVLAAARRLGARMRSENAFVRARVRSAGLRTPDHFFGESGPDAYWTMARTLRHRGGTAGRRIVGLIEPLRRGADQEGFAIKGIGVGVPGVVDATAGRIGDEAPHVPDLAGQPLAAILGQRFGLPVFVDNDVNALALAELLFGLGRGAHSLVVLAPGTGFGSGIVLGGPLGRGGHPFGGDVGHP